MIRKAEPSYTELSSSEWRFFSYQVGPTADIHQIWTEHNVRHDDDLGMMIHASFHTANVEGENLQAIAFLHVNDSAETPVTASGEEFRTVEGQLCVSDSFAPPHQFTVYKDLQLFLPYRTLECRDLGKWNFKYRLIIRRTGPGWAELARSRWETFSLDVRPAAEIRHIRTEHNICRDGEIGMVIHSSFGIHNAQGRQVQITAHFYQDSISEPSVKTSAPAFRAPNGDLCVASEFKPAYQFTTYDDFQLFLPYRTIDIESQVASMFKYIVVIHNPQCEPMIFTTSKWQRFQLTH